MDLKNSVACGKEQNYCFFIPVSKLVHNSPIKKEFESNGNILTINTSHGRVQIRNRLLTETHQKLLNEIIAQGTINNLSNGGVEIKFFEDKILKQLKMGEKNLSFLRSQIQEIADASFYIGVRRARLLKIIHKHSFSESSDPSIGGFQKIELSPEYVDAKRMEFIIANSAINKNLREIEISTIPTIIRSIYVISKGKADVIIELDEILDRIYFLKTDNTIRGLRKNLEDFSIKLESNFFIKYHSKDKTFTTMQQIEKYLIDQKKELSREDLEKLNDFHGLKFNSGENEIHIIKKIKSISFKEFEIITEDEQVFEFNEYFDDFLFFLEGLHEKSEKKKIIRQTLF